MNFQRAPLAAAIIAASIQMPVADAAQAATPAAAPAVVASAPAKAAVATNSATEWIQFDDLTVTPVLDDVSSHFAAARAALAEKDNGKAAEEMQAAARALEAQADRAARLDRERAAADLAAARDVRARMLALVRQFDAAAAQIKAGKLTSTAGLDKAIGKAQRADLERRWLLTDVTTWYPVSDEPQRHFGAAVEAYARKEYNAAASEVRKGAAYVRLEAGRATGDAKNALDAASADLQKTAAALDEGVLKAGRNMETSFARADHALALAHRARAAEALAHREYERAGFELKAAAQGLESAAAWTGAEARAATAAAVADARTAGDDLAGGSDWARNEVAKGFESLGNGLTKLGQAIGTRDKGSPQGART